VLDLQQALVAQLKQLDLPEKQQDLDLQGHQPDRG
jgi:hypothetical protein